MRGRAERAKFLLPREINIEKYRDEYRLRVSLAKTPSAADSLGFHGWAIPRSSSDSHCRRHSRPDGIIGRDSHLEGDAERTGPDQARKEGLGRRS